MIESYAIDLTIHDQRDIVIDNHTLFVLSDVESQEYIVMRSTAVVDLVDNR